MTHIGSAFHSGASRGGRLGKNLGNTNNRTSMEPCFMCQMSLLTVIIATGLYMHIYNLPQAPFAYTGAPGFDSHFL
jgi:hypothetical protein